MYWNKLKESRFIADLDHKRWQNQWFMQEMKQTNLLMQLYGYHEWLIGWLIDWAYFYTMPMPSQSRLSKLSIDTKIVSIGLKLATVQALLCNIIEYWFILTIYTIISSQFNLFRRRRLFYVVGDAKAVVVFFRPPFRGPLTHLCASYFRT